MNPATHIELILWESNGKGIVSNGNRSDVIAFAITIIEDGKWPAGAFNFHCAAHKMVAAQLAAQRQQDGP